VFSLIIFIKEAYLEVYPGYRCIQDYPMKAGAAAVVVAAFAVAVTMTVVMVLDNPHHPQEKPLVHHEGLSHWPKRKNQLKT